MVRYLSSAWFDRLREQAGPFGASDGGADLVLRYRVGDDAARVDYDVVVGAGRASVRHPVEGRADLVFTSDYPTAAAVASGRLSTQAALSEGRIRVAGDVGVLARHAGTMTGLDPLPPGLRAETEF